MIDFLFLRRKKLVFVKMAEPRLELNMVLINDQKVGSFRGEWRHHVMLRVILKASIKSMIHV
jgi:hypothetical protein